MPTVVVLHHHPVIRLGIVAVLELDPDIEVIAHGDTPEVIPRDASRQPRLDVLMVAARLHPNGAVRRVAHELAGRVPILAICSPTPDDRNLVELRAGVLGRISADVSHDELVAAVHRLSDGFAAALQSS